MPRVIITIEDTRSGNDLTITDNMDQDDYQRIVLDTPGHGAAFWKAITDYLGDFVLIDIREV